VQQGGADQDFLPHPLGIRVQAAVPLREQFEDLQQALDAVLEALFLDVVQPAAKLQELLAGQALEQDSGFGHVPDTLFHFDRLIGERETIDAEEVKMLIEGKTLPPMRSVLASPTDTGGTPQQVLKPEGRGGPPFPEGSPSPA